MAEFYRKKKKVCPMCAGKEVDYKNFDVISRFVSKEKGKILPKSVAGEVKKARFMALLPFVK